MVAYELAQVRSQIGIQISERVVIAQRELDEHTADQGEPLLPQIWNINHLSTIVSTLLNQPSLNNQPDIVAQVSRGSI